MKELQIENYVNSPTTAKDMIIWDEGKSSTSPINLLNAIWTITVNEVIQSKESKSIPNAKKIAIYIKGEILATTTYKNSSGNKKTTFVAIYGIT